MILFNSLLHSCITFKFLDILYVNPYLHSCSNPPTVGRRPGHRWLNIYFGKIICQQFKSWIGGLIVKTERSIKKIFSNPKLMDDFEISGLYQRYVCIYMCHMGMHMYVCVRICIWDWSLEEVSALHLQLCVIRMSKNQFHKEECV